MKDQQLDITYALTSWSHHGDECDYAPDLTMNEQKVVERIPLPSEFDSSDIQRNGTIDASNEKLRKYTHSRWVLGGHDRECGGGVQYEIISVKVVNFQPPVSKRILNWENNLLG